MRQMTPLNTKYRAWKFIPWYFFPLPLLIWIDKKWFSQHVWYQEWKDGECIYTIKSEHLRSVDRNQIKKDND